MNKKTTRLLMGICVTALAASLSSAVVFANAESTEQEQTTPVLTMQEGASIRYMDPVGIRFVTDVATDKYNKILGYDSEAVFGTLIIPKKVLGNTVITAENYLKIDAENIVANTWLADTATTKSFACALGGTVNEDGSYNDFPKEYYNAELYAVSYCSYKATADATENTVIFAENPQCYSVAYIASDLQARGDEDKILSGITDSVLGDSLAFEKENYTVGNGSQLATAVTSSGLKVTSYESSNNDVVTVDEKGMLTAVSDGIAEITAKIGGKTATTTVSVFSATVDAVASEKIYADDINSAQVRLSGYIDGKAVDGKETLSYAVKDGNVATVSETGLVTARTSGKTQLTVTYGDTSTACTVDTTKENVRRVDLFNVGLERWVYSQAFRDGAQNDTLLEGIYGVNRPIGGRNPVGNYFWSWEYTCNEATKDNGVNLNFRLQQIYGKRIEPDPATVDDLKALYSAGYTTVVMPIYLQYNETTDRSNEPRE